MADSAAGPAVSTGRCAWRSEDGALEDEVLSAQGEVVEVKEETTCFDGQWMYNGEHVATIRGSLLQWADQEPGAPDVKLEAAKDGFVFDNYGQCCEAKLTWKGELLWNDNEVWTRARAPSVGAGPSLTTKGHTAFVGGNYAEAVLCFAEAGVEGACVQLFHDLAMLLAWEAEGIPALRMSSFQAAADLAAEYKKRSAEVKAKGCSAFCAKRFREAIPLLSEALALDANDSVTQELLQYARMQEWEKEGIPVLRLGDYSEAWRLVEQCEQLAEMTLAELRQWYTGFGFPDEQGLQRADIINCAKRVKIWQALPISELYLECEQRSVSLRNIFLDDIEAQRTELIKSLLYADRMDAWETRLPAKRIGDVYTVSQVIRELEEAERMTMPQLLDWYKNLGLPEEARLKREELLGLSKKITVWQALPLHELQHECRARGIVSGDVTSPQPGVSAEELTSLRVTSLINELLIKERMEAWERTGCYEAKRLGDFDLVIEVIGRHMEIERMSEEELREWYKSCGYPAERGLQIWEITALYKKAVIWNSLPLTELRKECLCKGIEVGEANVDSSGAALGKEYDRRARDSSAGSTGGAQDEEEEERLRLLNLLLLHERIEAWEAKGFEAKRIRDPDMVMAVMHEFDAIDHMSFPALRDWYVGLGFPEEQDIQRQDVVALYRKVKVWQAVPLAELQHECRLKQLAVAVDSTSEEEYRLNLLDKLIIEDRRGVWNAKGFHASRIEKAEDVVQTVLAYEGYVRMDDEELRKACCDVGFPDALGLGRTQMLRNIKMLLVWEQLPLHALQAECKERGLPQHLPPIRNVNERRAALVQRLRMDLQVNHVFGKEPLIEPPPPQLDVSLPKDLCSASSASCESLPALIDHTAEQQQQLSASCESLPSLVDHTAEQQQQQQQPQPQPTQPPDDLPEPALDPRAEEQRPVDCAAPSHLEEWYGDAEPAVESDRARLLEWAAAGERGDAVLLARLVDRLGEEDLNVSDVPELGSLECTEFLEELGFSGAGECAEVERALYEFHAEAPVTTH